MEKIKTLTDTDYQAIFALSQFAFQYELSEDERVRKREEAARHTIWGWMEESELAAKVHLIPLSVYINGATFPMGGISSVATWPEYRRQGMVKQLLYHALTYMKASGYSISFLHPFAFSFYRKYGWEHAFTKQHVAIPVEKLKRNWHLSNGYVRRMQTPDIPLLQKIYSRYAKKWNGMLVRDENWWKQRIFTKDYQIAVAYDDRDQPAGYVLYQVKDEVVHVREFAYDSLQEQHQLWNFLANHDSMAREIKLTVPEKNNLSLILDEPRFEQKLVPYFMARIVDVQKFLQMYPFKENGKLTFVITDEFFPANSGTYQLNCTADKTTIEVDQPVANTEAIHCSIQVLSGMMMNYRRPKDYFEAGLITGTENSIEQLEVMIPDYQPFLNDFY